MISCGGTDRAYLVIVVTFVTATTLAAPQAAFGRPPSVVLVVSDDQAWTDFGFMGHEVINTPHLDRLAAESAVFERGYVPTSLCRPSLATLISGQYPHEHKITGNDPPKGVDRSKMLKHIRRIPSLPRLLREKNYLSFQSGKWWEGSYRLGGFTHGMTHGDPARGGRHGDEGLRIGRMGMQPLLDFVDACGDRPFFVWYAPFLPHTPHNPPRRLLEKYTEDGRPIEQSRYYAMCEWFDETCGRLLEFLDDRSLTETTLVIFVTDNGWIQRTPETPVDEQWRFQFAPRSKRSPYEGGIRTPILLRWPGRICPGRYDTPVSSADIAPTILAAAGIRPPETMTGVNLVEAAASDGETGRDAIFGEIFAHDVVDIDEPAQGLLYRWCIRDRWKLIVPAGEAESAELYDLAADPHETTDLAAKHGGVVARLRNLADAWWPAQAPR